MSGGANVTVTIGAAFAGSFKSVLGEADRDLKGFGKRTARSMKVADRAAAGLGKSVAGIGKAAKEAHTAIGATARELHSLRGGASHAATAAREMRTLAQSSRRAVRAIKAVTAATARGAKAQAARTSVKPVALANDIKATAAEMPKAYKRAVAESVSHVKAGSKEIRRAMAGASNGNVTTDHAQMPAGFGRAIRSMPGVVSKPRTPRAVANGNVTADQPGMPAGFGKATRTVPGVVTKPPRPATVANDMRSPLPTGPRTASGVPAIVATPPANTSPWSTAPATPPPVPPVRRTGSGVPSVRAAPVPAAPWGSPPPRTPRAAPPGGGGGRRGRGAGGGPGARRGGHGAPGGHAAPGSHDAAAIGSSIGAMASAHGIWDMVKSAGAVNDMQVLLKLQGRTQQEIDDTTKAAQKISRENPAISTLEAMKSIVDVADTGDRDMKKAARLAPFIANSAKMTALVSDDAMKGHLGEDQSRYLGRAIEDMGKGTKSEGEIKEFVDAVTAGTIATRGIFNPKELFQTIQKSGGAARGWDNEFVGKVLPAITMAMGGSGAGDAAYMFQKLLVKGQGQVSSAKALMDLGLINKKDLNYDGKKFLGITPDSMPNAELLRKNQFEWFKQTVVPAALAKTGITDMHAERKRFEGEHANDAGMSGLNDDQRKSKMTDMFKEHIDGVLQKSTDTFAKAKNTSKMIADFIAQSEQIDAMVAQMKKQPKNATEIMMGENFDAQVAKIVGSFHSFTAAMGAPEVGLAITAMNSISGTMSSLASAATANPETVKSVMAAFAAVTAGFAGAGIVGLAGTVALSGGPIGLAIGAIAAGLAAWTALDWDGAAEAGNSALTAIEAIGSFLKNINSALGLDEDGKGTNAVGRMVSRFLGNNEESLGQDERNRMGNDRDKAAEAYKATEKDQGFRGNKRAEAKAKLDAAQATLDDLDARREKYAKRDQTPGARTVAKKNDPQTVIGTMDQMSGKSAATLAEERAAQKVTLDNARAAAEHEDHTRTEAIKNFKPKEQREPVKKSIRYGDKPAGAVADAAKAPISAENVHVTNPPTKPSAPQAMEKVAPRASVAPAAPGVPATPAPSPIQAMNRPVPVTITGPTPGAQGAPAVPAMPVKPVALGAGATPGAAVATGGKTVVDLAGPVAIKDEVGIKQPLRLVTPVLVTASGIMAVHDSATSAAVSGLTGQLAGMAGTLSGILSACQATAASCATVAAKDFSPKITVQGGGTTAAAKERSSFSD